MGAIHKPRKFQFREIQNREIQEVAVCTLQGTRVTQGNSAMKKKSTSCQTLPCSRTLYLLSVFSKVVTIKSESEL